MTKNLFFCDNSKTPSCKVVGYGKMHNGVKIQKCAMILTQTMIMGRKPSEVLPRAIFCEGPFTKNLGIPNGISYSLRPILPFTNMDVSRHILVLDTSIFVKGNMGRREYMISIKKFLL
jgi:hypothetical protein